MNNESIKYIIMRIVERALDANNEYKANKDDAFQQGRNTAYYEVLDILRSELEVREEDLKDYGLNIDLEKDLL